MPFSDEEIIQKLTHCFPEFVWQLRGDKFISSVLQWGPPPHPIALYENNFDLVQHPAGCKLSIPRVLANQEFEHMDAAIAAAFQHNEPANPQDFEDAPDNEMQPLEDDEIAPAANPEPEAAGVEYVPEGIAIGVLRQLEMEVRQQAGPPPEQAPANVAPPAHEQQMNVDPNAELEDIPQEGQPQWEDEIVNPPAPNPEPEQNEAPPSPRGPRNR